MWSSQRWEAVQALPRWVPHVEIPDSSDLSDIELSKDAVFDGVPTPIGLDGAIGLMGD